MMIKEKLEKALKDFLEKENRNYYKDSINYNGIRNSKRIDGSERDLHIVSFMVSTSDIPYDSDAHYFAAFDKEKHHLVEIIGPQSWEKFE